MKKYDKFYFEKYAKILLYKVINSDYYNLSIADKPDLQDLKENKFGVEVTRGINKNQGNYISFINENMGKGKSKEDLLHIANKRKLAPWISQGEGVTAYAISQGLQDVNVLKNNTSDYIENKIIKLNKNYLYFDSDELFIFLNFDYNKRDIQEIINKVNFEKYDKTFDKIFLLAYNILFEYNKIENCIKEHVISNNVLIDTKVLAQSPHSNQD